MSSCQTPSQHLCLTLIAYQEVPNNLLIVPQNFTPMTTVPTKEFQALDHKLRCSEHYPHEISGKLFTV